MARISTYALDAKPELGDKVLGTDTGAKEGLVTKNYSLREMVEMFNQKNAIAVAGQSIFRFQYDDLTISTSGSTGITLFSATGNAGNIAFGDGTSGDDRQRGLLQYHHSDNTMRFFTNAARRMTITSGGSVGINTTAPESNSNDVSLHIHGSANDDARIAFSTPTKSNPGSRIGYYGLNRFGIDTYDGLEVRDVTASYATRFKIDQNGYVTKPDTPAFFASHSGADNAQTGYLTFNSGTNGYYNNGSHFDLSSGAFHAPVTGIYFFHFHGFLQTNVSTGNFEYTMRRTNSDGSGVTSVCRQYGYRHESGEYGPSISMMTTQPMTAGQTMRVHISTKPLHGSNGYYFGGFLIG